MGTRIFWNASPKAVGGITRHYKTMGAKIRTITEDDGEAVVIVEHPSITTRKRERVRVPLRKVAG